MWAPLNLHGIRVPHASFRLKPEATHRICLTSSVQTEPPEFLHHIESPP
jgi:hypothetical protein